MMRALRNIARDERGISAMEFSLLAPILATVLVLGWDGWMMISQSLDMRTAVQTGARYYQIGGSNDTDALAAVNAAWTHKPATGATVGVGRSCTCGTSPNTCGQTCASGTAMTFITLSAGSTFSGMAYSRDLHETEVIRVQ